MSETLTWRDDGTPVSPRFDDVYCSRSGGLQQAQHVFIHGCKLEQRWQGQRNFVILETGFGLGINFLATWLAWRQHPKRPQHLHYVSIEAWPVSLQDLLQSAQAYPPLQDLVQELGVHWWGLRAGFHRMVLDEGRVHLTLCVGAVGAVLRELQVRADAVYLDGFSPQKNPDMWSLDTLKGVSQCCVPEVTTLATWTVASQVRAHLKQLGFVCEKVTGLPPKRHSLQALYAPHWPVRTRAPLVAAWPDDRERRCVIIGAGIAGATCAAALAQRGWQVTVMDARPAPAQGASGLPVGLFCPHFSSDDGRLSRLTRAGLRLTRQSLSALLEHGQDWALTGVLEHRLHGRAGPAQAEAADYHAWSLEAEVQQKSAAHLPEHAPVSWHRWAGWVRPASWVQALLNFPWQGSGKITMRYGVQIAQISPTREGQWCLLDQHHNTLDSAPLVIVAAGDGTPMLVETPMSLQLLRGQLSWALESTQDALPAMPVNGRGSLIGHIPAPQGSAWFTGSTFELLTTSAPWGAHDSEHDPSRRLRESEHVNNLQQLGGLIPESWLSLNQQGDVLSRLQGWTGVRCASADRLPLVGPADLEPSGVWVCSALGTRGLTWAMLCAELLAAHLTGEPLPVELSHARALLARRTPRSTRHGGAPATTTDLAH